MFGLEKLSFKTKVIIVSLIVIITSMGIVYIRNTHPITVTKIDNWAFIANNDTGKWYYNVNLVNVDDKNHIVTVWLKNVYTITGRQDFLKTHKEVKYKDIYRSLSFVSIDYNTMDYHEKKVVYYNNSGEILGSDELSAKSSELLPKTVMDKLLIKILRDYNIKR
jgi:hypothetical protein